MAPTGWLLFIWTVHVVAVSGVQFEDQPPKVEPFEGAAVSTTGVPNTKLPVQPAMEAGEQLIIPTGRGRMLVTVPVPKPTL
jgi:hypothetical protein